jgi:hypothetical protein
MPPGRAVQLRNAISDHGHKLVPGVQNPASSRRPGSVTPWRRARRRALRSAEDAPSPRSPLGPLLLHAIPHTARAGPWYPQPRIGCPLAAESPQAPHCRRFASLLARRRADERLHHTPHGLLHGQDYGKALHCGLGLRRTCGRSCRPPSTGLELFVHSIRRRRRPWPQSLGFSHSWPIPSLRSRPCLCAQGGSTVDVYKHDPCQHLGASASTAGQLSNGELKKSSATIGTGLKASSPTT